MKNYFTKFNMLTLTILASITLFMSSCSEDIINPDSSAMPPKNEIKTPPRKK